MNDQIPPPEEQELSPERPLECSECKKGISVVYTEIVGGVMTHTSMCSSCPELYRRLHGAKLHPEEGAVEGALAGIACGECGTTLAGVRTGAPLGCSHCYEVFDDALVTELLALKKVPPRVSSFKPKEAIHVGRGPGEIPEINPSLRLIALNEALNETLQREDYEQSALLRDQIKELTEEGASDEEK